MKKMKLVLPVMIFVIAIVSIIISTRTGQGQSSADQSLGNVPIVDFDAPTPSDMQEQLKRMRRGEKYKTDIALDKMEDQTELYSIPDPHAPVESAFPVDQSDVIVIGTVVDSRAFVSTDRTAVYSEFEVKLDQILKPNSQTSLNPGSRIIAERIGGKVRFPSGRIQQRGILGHNLPQQSHDYILFLKRDESAENYLIITGYRLFGNSVSPLDGLRKDNPRIYRNYQRYKNADRSAFLRELQRTINGDGDSK